MVTYISDSNENLNQLFCGTSAHISASRLGLIDEVDVKVKLFETYLTSNTSFSKTLKDFYFFSVACRPTEQVDVKV